MKKRRKIKLKYKKDRVLLSDVLPYELPIIMSNRALYRFCVKNKVCYDSSSNVLSWDKEIEPSSFETLKMLFRPAFNPKTPLPISSDGRVSLSPYSTTPFTFRILHKDSDFRSLSVVHPAMQIGMVDFYNRFKSLIIHYCTRSSFSLRHPQKVASFFFYKDRLHDNLLGTKKDKIELFFNEYENLKTFFSYRKYNQIYRFYDDYRFLRAEKRFSNLLRFDIQKCFDHIYTHSIAWATHGGKEAYHRNSTKKDSSFGDIFDTAMHRLNSNETNGIVIGPEFSRIFAEIILQHIDRNVEYILDKEGIKLGLDYQLYRYVDDYFLFFNEDKVANRIRELLNVYLNEYRLNIGEEKTKKYERPFLTEISRAKIRIDKLIGEWFKFQSSEVKVDDLDVEEERDRRDEETESDGSGFIPILEKLNRILNSDGYYPLNALKFTREFKDIILSSGVKTKDVLNYSLSCIATRIERELSKFNNQWRYLKLTTLSGDTISEDIRNLCADRLKKMESKLARFLTESIEASFFLFALNRRITTTLKLSQILNTIITFLNGRIRWNGEDVCNRFNKKIRQIVFSLIQNEVIDILRLTKSHEYAQLEVLYLLIIMRSIEATNTIPAEILKNHIGLGEKGRLKLNAIAIIVILYYIGNKNQYTDLKDLLLEHLIQSIKHKDLQDVHKDSESMILALDLACCPYLETSKKVKILDTMGLYKDEIDNILVFGQKQKYFFTKWNGVDVRKELAAKLSQEVYS